MGSWNHTCMLSRMSVGYGEDVVAIWMTRYGKDTGFYCYQDDIWAPIPMPLYGKYDDYGRVEYQPSAWTEHFWNHIKPQFKNLEKDEHRRMAEGLQSSDLDFESLHDADHNGLAFLKSIHGKDYVPLRHVVIKKSLWDAILQNYQLEEYLGDQGTGNYKDNYRKVSFQDLISDLDSQIDQLKASFKGKESWFWTMDDRPFRDCQDVPIAKWLGRAGHNYAGHDVSWTLLMRNLTNDELKPLLIEYLELAWIRSWMTEGHFQWGPIAGSCQDLPTNPYELLADFYGEEIKRIKDDIEVWDEAENG